MYRQDPIFQLLSKARKEYLTSGIEGASSTLKQVFDEFDRIDKELPKLYDSSFDPTEIKRCCCGHMYYRHFDSYDDNAPVGCKYCDCREWHEFDLTHQHYR